MTGTDKQTPSQSSVSATLDPDEAAQAEDLSALATPSQRNQDLAQPDGAGPQAVDSTDSSDRVIALTQASGSSAQAQSDSHSLRSDPETAEGSFASASAVPSTSDVAVASLGASVASGSPKSDPGGLALIGTPPTATNAQPGAPVPSAVLARNAAENIELSNGLQAWNGGDNAQTRLVQSAKVDGSLHSSEMNIALQAEELGPVELRARVTGDSVGATIGVERHDAHSVIASELPALHQALNDRQLRVADLSVFQGSIHSGGAPGNGHSSQQRDTGPQRAARQDWPTETNSPSLEFSAISEGGDAATLFDSNGRLSVRA